MNRRQSTKALSRAEGICGDMIKMGIATKALRPLKFQIKPKAKDREEFTITFPDGTKYKFSGVAIITNGRMVIEQIKAI